LGERPAFSLAPSESSFENAFPNIFNRECIIAIFLLFVFRVVENADDEEEFAAMIARTIAAANLVVDIIVFLLWTMVSMQ
jgi:hypothetical protein